jgi:hypothetical protein
MLNTHIDDTEYLYRRIILNPNFWDFENNKPTSAIFKDSNGVSVDRHGIRDEVEIIDTFKKFPIRAIGKIKAETCRKSETYLTYKPIDTNIYHSEIHDSEQKIQISSSKAKKLRDKIEIIYLSQAILN